MEAYELVATLASRIELAVDRYVVHDSGAIADYRGPQLIVDVHANRLVTIHELGRQVDELAPQQTNALVELGLAACDEHQAPFGIDTAIGRPITTYRLGVYRALREATRQTTHQINHHGPQPLGPAFSTFLTALREATGPLPMTAATAWDVAARWLGARDLGPLWHAGQPVPLPSIITAVSCDEVVHLRAGQPPQRSELYRLDGNELAWLRANHAPIALTMYDGLRWILPCGAGVVEVHHEWQEPRRIYVRIDDPARGIFVQRG